MEEEKKMDNKKQTEQSKQAIIKVWDNVFFMKFMGLRFPQETNISYITEWMGRIQNYSVGYMDLETRKAYNETIEFMLKNY